MDLYNELKDKNIIRKINDRFYEKVYKHPWLSQFFAAVEQDFISAQQSDFIVGAIGGPKLFSGRFPSNAHPHMLITDELFDLREQLLIEAMDEIGAPEKLQIAWLRIDESFRRVIVKKSLSECKPRYGQEALLAFPKPVSRT